MQKANQLQVIEQILERFHFAHIDKGTSVDATPLKAHEHGKNDLTPEVARFFRIPSEKAAEYLREAVAEVISRVK